MKLMSFPEINDLENGQQIPSFQGTIKKVFDPKTGVGDYGPWSLQSLILTDEHANEIKVTWAVEDVWDASTEGKRFLFESGYDKKDQLVGLKKEIRNKNGNKYESVKVDDRAKVKVLNGETSRNEKPISGEPSQDLGYDPAEFQESSVHAPNGNGGVTDARKHLCQAANLYNLCVACVDTMIAPGMPPIAQTSEQFQAAVGTLFIEASRAGYVQKMPEKPL
jgi:hypothetical protein